MKGFLRFLLLLLSIGLVYSAVRFYDIHVKIPELEELEEFETAKEIVEEIKGPGGAGVIRNDIRVEQEELSETQSSFAGSVDDIISLANEARKEKNLAPLTKNEQLMNSALIKTQDMKDNNYFEHVSPSGLDMSYFVRKTGYNYSTVGENLAEGYFSAQSVHEAWMSSEGHRENIMSADFEEIGVAILEIEKDGYKSYILVQHFGSQFKQEEAVTVVVCKKKVKRECAKAEEQREEVKDVIEEQEEIIDDAKDEGYSDKDLQELYENLENLEEIKDDLKDYIRECEEFIEQCDEWK